jgi:hypothetical protein
MTAIPPKTAPLLPLVLGLKCGLPQSEGDPRLALSRTQALAEQKWSTRSAAQSCSEGLSWRIEVHGVRKTEIVSLDLDWPR